MRIEYLQIAARLIGEFEVRYNWASAKSNPREVVLNLWAKELSQITLAALTPDLIDKAIHEWDADHNGKPPLVGQFMAILRRNTSDIQHRQLAHEEKKEEHDWFGEWEKADPKHKFKFFFNREVPSVMKYHAKQWYKINTTFDDNEIHKLVSGQLP